MICPSCGTEGQGSFCGECGTALTDARETASTVEKLSFWHAGTLGYMAGGVALLVYTCIYYWN